MQDHRASQSDIGGSESVVGHSKHTMVLQLIQAAGAQVTVTWSDTCAVPSSVGHLNETCLS
jgi:uncharacterized protein YjlB